MLVKHDKIFERILKSLLVLFAFIICFSPSSFSQLAKGKSKFVGNVIHDPTNITSNFSEYWNQVTPENAGKWGSIQGSDTSSFNWTPLDETYNYAISHNFPFKEHNLIWGQQQPTFMTDGSLDSAQEYRAIVNWIDSCGHRYSKAAFCDVVNEPIHTPPPYTSVLGGNGSTGWDWVINAFELARNYWSRDTKLLLNEYSVLNSRSTTAEYLHIIRLLQARGAYRRHRHSSSLFRSGRDAVEYDENQSGQSRVNGFADIHFRIRH